MSDGADDTRSHCSDAGTDSEYDEAEHLDARVADAEPQEGETKIKREPGFGEDDDLQLLLREEGRLTREEIVAAVDTKMSRWVCLLIGYCPQYEMILDNVPAEATANGVGYNEPSEDEASNDEEICSNPDTEHGGTGQDTESERESESMASDEGEDEDADEDEDEEGAPALASTEGDGLDDLLADAGEMARDEIVEAVNKKLHSWVNVLWLLPERLENN
ncbi:hypothetical protein SLS55_006907 [Diplodia seriata]|uniref:Uncharacterized protein n=1 Tax=Diplodia seriata TaxID=420778 RepID=A0ABR3CAV3_9PEZI